MSVAQILANKGREVVTAAPHRTLREIVTILNEKGIGAIVVSDPRGSVLGIFSERDLVRALGRSGSGVLDEPVSRHMTSRVTTITETVGVLETMERMTDGRFRHLPVVEGDKLVGLVSIGDVVKHRIAEIEHERKAMLEYIGTA